MSARRGDKPPVEKLLGIAEYHREHERFYASEGLRQALELRQDAEALKRLGEQWIRAEGDGRAERESEASFQAVGSPDLNDWAAIATAGILFMEGEAEPAELPKLRERLRSLAAEFRRYDQWLAEKMDAGWAREGALLEPDSAETAYVRHMVLTRTTLHGAKVGVAGRLIAAAERALSAVTFDPETIRSRRAEIGALARSAGWLLDGAATVLAEQAAELGLADPDWTRYMEALAPAASERAERGARTDGKSPPAARTPSAARKSR